MTAYHKYLRSWTDERNITSFLGSEKQEFLADWKDIKMKPKRPLIEVKTEPMEIAEPTVSEKVSPKITIAPPKSAPKPTGEAALKVLTNPNLLKEIGSFTNSKNRGDAFFSKTSSFHDAQFSKRFFDFLIERGMKTDTYKGEVFLKDRDQYISLMEILAKVIYHILSFRQTGFAWTDRYGNYRDGSYDDYREAIETPAFRKVIRLILNKKIPDDFDYARFWSLVSNNHYPDLTRIDNVSMKKLFSNWKHKGRRYKVEAY